jgi:cytochrome c biogenesis protein CcmG/thiol:disulfide interchange protein DsbE
VSEHDAGTSGGDAASGEPDVVAADEDADAAGAPRRVAPWVALGVAVVLAGLFVVLVSASGDDGVTADSPLLGRAAPEAIGEYEDGSTFDLARRKGSWVVLNFFTADCVPCIQEHPDLVAFSEQQAQLGTEGAELYSVVVNDSRDDVEEFFDERGGDWPAIYSELGEMPVAFGVSAVPETWIIDPAGVVRVRMISKVTAEQLNVTLQQLREGA